MSFVKSKPKEESTVANKQSPPSSPAPVIPKDMEIDESKQKKTSRLGRSATRRFLYFHNKTLSKIKLL